MFKWRMNVVTINRPVKVSASRVRVIQTYEFCCMVRCDVRVALLACCAGTHILGAGAVGWIRWMVFHHLINYESRSYTL